VLLQFKEVFAPAETLLKNVEVLLRGKGGGEPYKVQLAVLARAGCDCDCDCDVATRANQLSRCLPAICTRALARSYSGIGTARTRTRTC
jgi:hypothetical protein